MPRPDASQPPVGLPPLVVSDSDPLPLYLRLAHHIEESIRGGHLKPGDRLDGELGLAKAMGVSRQTMRKALDEMVRQGLIVRRHGAGTQVLPGAADRPAGVDGLFDELKRAGGAPRTQVIIFAIQPASPSLRDALWLGDGDEVLVLKRLRYDGNTPVAIMRNHLPASLVEIDRSDLESGGLYELMRSQGVNMRMAQQSIAATAADPESARLLDVAVGHPLLTLETTTYADSGRPVEVGFHEYRGDMYRYPVTKVERQYGTEAIR